MNAPAPFLMVPFREVRHNQPDDCLHYEPIGVRGELHQWTIPAHRHDNLHQFHLLCEGAVEGVIDGVRQTLRAPVAWMVAPGVVHSFSYERNSVGHQVTVPSQMLRSTLASVPALLPLLKASIVAEGGEMARDAAECAALFERVAQEFGSHQVGRNEALHCHAMLLGLWFLRREPVARETERRLALRDTLVQRFRGLVETHFREHKLVQFYAQGLGVSADHLGRVCRTVTGSGALELIHDRVVLEARRLLAYTPTTVAAVAHALGFEDPGYFSRFFSKYTGHSPSNYRLAVGEGLGVVPSEAASFTQ